MATEILRPNGDLGGQVYLTPSSGSDHYALVDEAVLDASDYNYTSLDYVYDFYDIAATSAASGKTINSVTVHAQCKASAGTKTPRFGVYTDTSYYGSNESVSITTVEITETWALNPETAAAWTSAEIDGMQIGINGRALGGDTLYVYQIWLVVDYTPAGGADAFIEGLSRIAYGIKPVTAAGLGGALIE